MSGAVELVGDVIGALTQPDTRVVALAFKVSSYFILKISL